MVGARREWLMDISAVVVAARVVGSQQLDHREIIKRFSFWLPENTLDHLQAQRSNYELSIYNGPIRQYQNYLDFLQKGILSAEVKWRSSQQQGKENICMKIGMYRWHDLELQKNRNRINIGKFRRLTHLVRQTERLSAVKKHSACKIWHVFSLKYFTAFYF